MTTLNGWNDAAETPPPAGEVLVCIIVYPSTPPPLWEGASMRLSEDGKWYDMDGYERFKPAYWIHLPEQLGTQEPR